MILKKNFLPFIEKHLEAEARQTRPLHKGEKTAQKLPKK